MSSVFDLRLFGSVVASSPLAVQMVADSVRAFVTTPG